MKAHGNGDDGTRPRVWVIGRAGDLVDRCVSSLEGENLGCRIVEPGSVSFGYALVPGPDLFVILHRPPVVDGIRLLLRLRRSSNRPVIVLSDSASIPACEAAMRGGADRFLLEADLARLGEIVRGLLDPFAAAFEEARPVVTAAEARRLRDRELCEHLRRLLSVTRGNIAEMARQMGKDRSTVRYHLQRFGMLRDPAREKCGRGAGDSARSS